MNINWLLGGMGVVSVGAALYACYNGEETSGLEQFIKEARTYPILQPINPLPTVPLLPVQMSLLPDNDSIAALHMSNDCNSMM